MNRGEIHLESVTWDNVDDIIPHGESGNGFFELPSNEDAADRFVALASNNRRHNLGDLYNVYDDNHTLVGGGQIIKLNEAVSLGYWVIEAKRRMGYGKIIAEKLEQKAAQLSVESTGFSLTIDPLNAASCALAKSMGYTKTGTDGDGMIVFFKSQSRINT